MNGKRTELVGKIQERYGKAQDEAEREVDDGWRATNPGCLNRKKGRGPSGPAPLFLIWTAPITGVAKGDPRAPVGRIDVKPLAGSRLDPPALHRLHGNTNACVPSRSMTASSISRKKGAVNAAFHMRKHCRRQLYPALISIRFRSADAVLAPHDRR